MRPLFGPIDFIFIFFINYIGISSGMYSRGQNQQNMPVDENGLFNFPADNFGRSDYDYPPGHGMQTHHAIPSGSPNFQQNHQNFYNNELPPILHKNPVSTTISNPQNLHHDYQHNTFQGRAHNSLDLYHQAPTSHATSVLGSSSTPQNHHDNHQRNTSQEPVRDKYDLFVQVSREKKVAQESSRVYNQLADDFPTLMKRFKNTGSVEEDKKSVKKI